VVGAVLPSMIMTSFLLSNVRTAAEQRGLKLITRVDEDGVIFQSVPLTDEDRAARAKRAENRAANQAAKANGN
jgi:hypothetical protein